MVLKAYKSSTLHSRLEDISDYVTAISGLEWKHDRDYRVTIPHPTLKVIDTIDIAVDDYIYFEFDNVIRLICYVDEINHDIENCVYSLSLYDLVQKLDDYFVCNLDDADFNDTSYWLGLSSSEQLKLYQYSYSTYPDDDRYIQILFLIQVLFHKALNYDLENIDLSLLNTESIYTKRNSAGIESFVDLDNIYMQWKMLRYTGREGDNWYDESGNYNYQSSETASLFELYCMLCQHLQIYHEFVNGKIYLKSYSKYNLPSLFYSYKYKNNKGYDQVKITSSQPDIPSQTQFNIDFDNYIDHKQAYPTLPTLARTKVKSFSITRGFQLFYGLYIGSSFQNKIRMFDFNNHQTFYYQWAVFLANILTVSSTKYTFSKKLEFTQNANKCSINYEEQETEFEVNE